MSDNQRRLHRICVLQHTPTPRVQTSRSQQVSMQTNLLHTMMSIQHQFPAQHQWNANSENKSNGYVTYISTTCNSADHHNLVAVKSAQQQHSVPHPPEVQWCPIQVNTSILSACKKFTQVTNPSNYNWTSWITELLISYHNLSHSLSRTPVKIDKVHFILNLLDPSKRDFKFDYQTAVTPERSVPFKLKEPPQPPGITEITISEVKNLPLLQKVTPHNNYFSASVSTANHLKNTAV
jgi:hypothetical protein